MSKLTIDRLKEMTEELSFLRSENRRLEHVCEVRRQVLADSIEAIDRLKKENLELKNHIVDLETGILAACESPCEDCDGCRFAASQHEQITSAG